MNKMDLRSLKGKKIALLGLGLENHSLARFLHRRKIDCSITVCDSRSAKELGKKFSSLDRRRNISWKLGRKAASSLAGFDIYFRSPGWPLFLSQIREAASLGIQGSSAMNLFFELCPTRNIIGVTGSKGKGTTASLIHAILKQAGKQAWIGGNIGKAPFDFMEKLKPSHWVVLELSSFQLEDLGHSPKIAVVTNFFPEHLAPADPQNPNYHRSLRHYWAAKKNIYLHQKRGDRLIVNKKLAKKMDSVEIKGRLIFFEKSDLPSRLPGEHNKENIDAARLAVREAGVGRHVTRQAVEKFKGLPFRIEKVAEINGVAYYNDSFSTTPESAITALDSFDTSIIWLGGGAEKGNDFKKLAAKLKKKARFIVLFSGKASPRLRRELKDAGFPLDRIMTVRSMPEAVALAKKESRPGDAVLMSPACASFGIFENYKQRGRLFNRQVAGR